MESKARRPTRHAKDASASSCKEVDWVRRCVRCAHAASQRSEPPPYGRERMAHHAETRLGVIQLGLGP